MCCWWVCLQAVFWQDGTWGRGVQEWIYALNHAWAIPPSHMWHASAGTPPSILGVNLLVPARPGSLGVSPWGGSCRELGRGFVAVQAHHAHSARRRCSALAHSQGQRACCDRTMVCADAQASGVCEHACRLAPVADAPACCPCGTCRWGQAGPLRHAHKWPERRQAGAGAASRVASAGVSCPARCATGHGEAAACGQA